MLNNFIRLMLLLCLSASPRLALCQKSFQLRIAAPTQPHQISDCQPNKLTDALHWQVYPINAYIGWKGVALLLHKVSQNTQQHLSSNSMDTAVGTLSDLRGMCFQLVSASQRSPIVQGAIVSQNPAPSLNVPVLILMNSPDSHVLEFALKPLSSVTKEEMPAWEQVLSNYSNPAAQRPILQDGSRR